MKRSIVDDTIATENAVGPSKKPHSQIIQNPEAYLEKCSFARDTDYLKPLPFCQQVKEKKFGGKVFNNVSIDVKKLKPESMCAEKRDSFSKFTVRVIK